MSGRLTRVHRVVLSDVERMTKGLTLARSGFELAQLEDGKAANAADFTKQIKKLKLRQGRLAYDMESGTEEREVEVEEIMRYEDLCVDLVVCQSGEVLESRPMTPAERQTQFNLVPIRPTRPEPETDPDNTKH